MKIYFVKIGRKHEKEFITATGKTAFSDVPEAGKDKAIFVVAGPVLRNIANFAKFLDDENSEFYRYEDIIF
jgi:hypothetical protein